MFLLVFGAFFGIKNLVINNEAIHIKKNTIFYMQGDNRLMLYKSATQGTINRITIARYIFYYSPLTIP